MILIFSSEADSSTCDVIDWLNFYNADFLRINFDDLVVDNDIKIEINNLSSDVLLRYREKTVDLKSISCFWYRRGGYFKFTESINWNKTETSKEVKNALSFDLWNEAKRITDFIHFTIKDKPSINSFFTSTPNKLIMLKTAVECGIKIPPTIITKNKSELDTFSRKNGNVITKGIDESIHFGDNQSFYSVYTEEITDIDKFPNRFFPSKVQQKIDKQFELRVFYFFGKFFSMAIFSQKNKKTSVDFRKYDEKKPNRCVPYELPKYMEDKLDELMKKMNLNCGSIDLIYSKRNEYIFLEINPVGQFGMVSTPCNYNIEKLIAEKLIEFEKNN
ncbi:grasp-with-spasm system ATP-grasp peptide maturase [Tenacibaculum xiamenense]|uniref:grasp-with-spasm system ATP-grasp peptide maturase n=1 Tax=Tenacibaculum xiamenense TaxID=1261553 RepID=UPI003893E1F2